MQHAPTACVASAPENIDCTAAESVCAICCTNWLSARPWHCRYIHEEHIWPWKWNWKPAGRHYNFNSSKIIIYIVCLVLVYAVFSAVYMGKNWYLNYTLLIFMCKKSHISLHIPTIYSRALQYDKEHMKHRENFSLSRAFSGVKSSFVLAYYW